MKMEMRIKLCKKIDILEIFHLHKIKKTLFVSIYYILTLKIRCRAILHSSVS